jgi:N-acetylmuramoyl-L-alanine amidase
MRENEVVLIEDNYKQHYSGFDPRSPESYIIFEMINDKNMLESVNLAKGIQKHVCRTAKRPNKGVKQDAFLVLRETSMPACLIELGYITTASEERYLNDQANQEALGRGIYQAFVEYKNSKMGQPAPQPAPAPKPETPVQKEQPKDSSKQEAPAVEREPVERGAVERESVAQTHTQQKEAPAQPKEQAAAKELPVFKVQFMASDRHLRAGDNQFKGLTGVESYKEGNLWKYTVGASTAYNEIRQLRKEVAKKFPQSFIVAFKNGERVDTQAAIQEYKSKK